MGELLGAVGYVDVVIPRGGAGLIRFVRGERAGSGDRDRRRNRPHLLRCRGRSGKGRAVICNAKTRRVSVCNALDCLIIHRDRLGDLAALCAPLAEHRVTIYADAPALDALKGHYPAALLAPATEEHYGTRVPGLQAGREERIVVRRSAGSYCPLLVAPQRGDRHQGCGRSRCFHAAGGRGVRLRERSRRPSPTAGSFGFGAEVGISTQKLHARGPMGLPEATT